MDPPSSSPERPKSVKVTYLGRQKNQKTLSKDAIESSDSEPNDDDNDKESKISSGRSTGKGKKGKGSMRPPDSTGVKKINFNEFKQPAPPSKHARRDSLVDAENTGKSLKSSHIRSSSSVTSLRQIARPGAGSTSARSSPKKPISISGSTKSKRQATPDTEMDDGASVAESFMSLGKVRRTEAERLEYFKNQPECDDIEPHRVKCLRCQKHVNLGRQRSYTVRPWEQHRARCDQNVPKSMFDDNIELGTEGKGGPHVGSTATPSVYPTSVRKSAAERKAILEADARAISVKPDEVLCKRCQKWIRLAPKSEYELGNWRKHQQSCSDAVPSSRVATAERKLKLVNDSQAKSYGVHNVVCDLCDTDVPLEGDGDYNLTSWESHKLQCSLAHPPQVASSPGEEVGPSPSVVSASTDMTAVEPFQAFPSRGVKRPLSEHELALDDPDTRPQNRPRSETYEAPQKEAPGPFGWFLMPFKAFVRGFKESLQPDGSA